MKVLKSMKTKLILIAVLVLVLLGILWWQAQRQPVLQPDQAGMPGDVNQALDGVVLPDVNQELQQIDRELDAL